MATASQEIRDLREELAELRASVKRTGNGIHRAGVVELNDLAHNAGASIRNLWDRSRATANGAYTSYETGVARHPLTSTAIAFALGAGLAAFFRRRY